MQRVELPLVLTGIDLETSSRIGFMMHFEEGESKRLEVTSRLSNFLACQRGNCSMLDGLYRRPPRDPERDFQDGR